MLDSLKPTETVFISGSASNYRPAAAFANWARCLFVRLYLRKGNFFRTDKLDYSEIGDLNGQYTI